MGSIAYRAPVTAPLATLIALLAGSVVLALIGRGAADYVPAADSLRAEIAELPLAFEPRRDGEFAAPSVAGGTLALSRGHAALSLPEPGGSASTLRLELAGANPHPDVTASEPLPGRVNRFIGDDPERWRTGVPTYGRVSFSEVYPGIGVDYYGNQRDLEYDFRLAPGADPNRIAIELGGAGRGAHGPRGRARDRRRHPSGAPTGAGRLPAHRRRARRSPGPLRARRTHDRVRARRLRPLATARDRPRDRQLLDHRRRRFLRRPPRGHRRRRQRRCLPGRRGQHRRLRAPRGLVPELRRRLRRCDRDQARPRCRWLDQRRLRDLPGRQRNRHGFRSRRRRRRRRVRHGDHPVHQLPDQDSLPTSVGTSRRATHSSPSSIPTPAAP